MRRGNYRNYIKDTWTKSRGRVEVGEGWGEKAHNCNLITIQNLKKKKKKRAAEKVNLNGAEGAWRPVSAGLTASPALSPIVLQ